MSAKLVYSIFEAQALRSPDHVVMIMRDEQLTYRQFFEQAELVAKNLQYLGLQGERIAIHLDNSIEFAILYLGSFMAGAIAVPISTGMKKGEIEYLLEKTSPKMLVSKNVQNLELFNFSQTSIQHLYTIENSPQSSHPFSQLLEKTNNAALRTPNSNDPLAIFFTSGSTAKPKGVVHSQSSFVAMLETMADAADLTHQDRFLVIESMSNASGCNHAFLAPSIGGASILTTGYNVPEFLDAIRHHPTRMAIIGKANYDIIHEPMLNSSHFKGITFNFSGGDKITSDLMQEFKKKTGCPIRLGYGMSEFLIFTVNKSNNPEKLTSVGQVAKGVEIRLLGQNGEAVPEGAVGEVWARGPNCMLGYWQDPQSTEKIIVDGWLRTGDLAKKDKEGFYWFIGRLKLIIVREGYNISPLEIEEILSQHPAVHVAAVIGIPDPGEGAVPKAFVELKPNHKATEAELIAFVKERLEDYKVPTAIKIVDQLPRTMSGKISRKDLS